MPLFINHCDGTGTFQLFVLQASLTACTFFVHLLSQAPRLDFGKEDSNS